MLRLKWVALRDSRIICHILVGGIIFLLASWTLFWRIGEGSLSDWDEATYAQIAREMVETGDWLTPHWNGFPLHDKPPLVMWVMAAATMITESMISAARLPAALAGLFTIAMTVWLGRSLFCTWTALAAATLLLAVGKDPLTNFALLSRQGMLDVPLAGFTAWALLHFWIGLEKPKHWLLMGIPLGLAALTKSFLVLPIVLVVFVFVTLLVLAGSSILKQHWLCGLGGVLIGLTVLLPWHLSQLVAHRGDFLDGYFLIHLMKTVRVESGNEGAWSFYIKRIISAVPYLSWICIPAVGFALWQGVAFRDRRLLLLVLWIVIPVAFFSSIPTKLPWYIVPVEPALALAVALLLRALVPQHFLLETLALGTLVLFICLWNGHMLKPLDETWDVKVLGDFVARDTPAGEQIAYYDPNESYQTIERPTWNIRPSVRFYANRPMIAIHDLGQLDEWIKKGGHFVWAEGSINDQLPPTVTLVAQVGNQRYFHRTGK